MNLRVDPQICYEPDNGSSVYLEARCHQIQTDSKTTCMPVVIGFRWQRRRHGPDAPVYGVVHQPRQIVLPLIPQILSFAR